LSKGRTRNRSRSRCRSCCRQRRRERVRTARDRSGRTAAYRGRNGRICHSSQGDISPPCRRHRRLRTDNAGTNTATSNRSGSNSTRGTRRHHSSHPGRDRRGVVRKRCRARVQAIDGRGLARTGLLLRRGGLGGLASAVALGTSRGTAGDLTSGALIPTTDNSLRGTCSRERKIPCR
ncbi:unnamed protein product, partial [Ectocarpus sp. 4 AP-2014]